MNNAKAITKYVRISPRKARLAAGLIRGLSVTAGNAATYVLAILKADVFLKKHWIALWLMLKHNSIRDVKIS